MADLSSSFSKVCEQFKFSELNKHQKEAIISAVLKKKDVFVSLPTGKNLSFFKLYLVIACSSSQIVEHRKELRCESASGGLGRGEDAISHGVSFRFLDFGEPVIFQALPMVFDGFTGESGHIVIVVSPLLSLIKDQTERLRQVGISCVSLSDVSTQGDIDLVEGGFYSVVYATPESLLKNERWRSR